MAAPTRRGAISPLTQITPDNVGKLRKVWEVHTGGMPTNPDYQKLYGTENTPLKIGNLLYTCTAKNMIVALDAATGKPVWRVDPHGAGRVDPVHDRVPRRGLLRGARRGRRTAVRGPDHRRDAGFAADRGRCADRQAVHRIQRHRPAGHQDRHGLGCRRARRRSTRRRPSCAGSSSSRTRCSTASAAARRRA